MEGLEQDLIYLGVRHTDGLLSVDNASEVMDLEAHRFIAKEIHDTRRDLKVFPTKR